MSEQIDLGNIHIKEFDPQNFSKDEWQLFHTFRKIKHEETDPDDPIADDESVEKSLHMLSKHPEANVNLFVIVDNTNNKIIGRMMHLIFHETSASYNENKHLMQFDLSLLANYRRKGIGTMAMKKIYDYALKQDKSVLISSTDEDDGKAFLKSLGAQTALSGVENRLKVEKIDWNMVEQWHKEGYERSPEARIELYYTISQEIIEEYCKIYTETLNQQPLGELDVGKIVFTPEMIRYNEKNTAELGRKHLTYMSIESNGDISGFTEMMYNPEKETMIVQLLTGVKIEYRGRGLGKWLKTAMLLKMREEFPQVNVVTTGNATTNAPMLSINDRLGFEVHKEGISAQMSLEKLGEYLLKIEK